MVNLVFNALPGPHTDDGYLTLHSLNVLLHYIGRKRFLDLEHTSAVAEVMVSVLGKVYRQISFLLVNCHSFLISNFETLDSCRCLKDWGFAIVCPNWSLLKSLEIVCRGLNNVWSSLLSSNFYLIGLHRCFILYTIFKVSLTQSESLWINTNIRDFGKSHNHIHWQLYTGHDQDLY